MTFIYFDPRKDYLKTGDRVRIEGVVRGVNAGTVAIDGGRGSDNFNIWPGHVCTYERAPEPLKAGDRVTHPYFDGLVGTLRCIDGDEAWVSIDRVYGNISVSSRGLRRACEAQNA